MKVVSDLQFVVIRLLLSVRCGFLWDASFPPPFTVPLLRVCTFPSFFLSPFTPCTVDESVWEKGSVGRETRRDQERLAKDFGSQWLGSGLTWSQRCQCGEKTGDAGVPRSEMETVKLKNRLLQFHHLPYFLDYIAGLDFQLELIFFQTTVSYLCSLFSPWLFFSITRDDDMRGVGGGVDTWDHPVQPPLNLIWRLRPRSGDGIFKLMWKLAEEPGPAAQLLNSMPKLSSLMGPWFNLWSSEKETSAEAAASEQAQKVTVYIYLSERHGKEKSPQPWERKYQINLQWAFLFCRKTEMNVARDTK